MHIASFLTAVSLAGLALWAGSSSAQTPAAPVKILFVGNSYTFARVAPAMQYNAARVRDLTAAFNAADPAGTNSFPQGSGQDGAVCATPGTGCFEPHPWGGVPGIFKQLTEQAGLDFEVSLSTRNGATLRGHFLNTANAAWDLRGNLASQRWDVVVLQGQSDEALPPSRAKNGNPVSFATYVHQIERYIHQGAGGVMTEAQIFAGSQRCTAATTAKPPGPGLSAARCATVHTLPANPHANPQARVYLFQTWARPDRVEPHLCTRPDLRSPQGAPIVDPTCAGGSNGSAVTGQARLDYTRQASTADNLREMTADLHDIFYGLVAGNPRLTDVVPVGDAFQRAVDSGIVKAGGFYQADGTHDDSGPPSLWWLDRTHPSAHGAYLTALMMLGQIAQVDPASLGRDERVAGELGIAAADAQRLQAVARATLVAAGVRFGR